MITRDNPSAYISLFDKANKALNLNEDKDKITNLNDYFYYLEQLQQYEKDNQNIDPIFLILPSDEETFDIDANTRQIKVPKCFSNGVSVQGDEVAEIVYFSIDRYFDTVDLYGKDILIQWQNPKGEIGLSSTYKKSLTLQPGKIVFGWPITSELTSIPGNITFAVRFYSREKTADGKKEFLTYSFSTLPSVVKINPSLDFPIVNQEVMDRLIDKTAMLEARLHNSQPGLDVETPDAAKPTFIKDLPSSQDLGEDGTVKLIAQAHIDNSYSSGVGSKLIYSWRYEGKGPQEAVNSYKLDYSKATDSVRNKNDIYYIQNDNNGYDPFTNQDEATYQKLLKEGKLFKLYTYLIADKAGTYTAIATNYYGKKSAAAESTHCAIPYALAPVFTQDSEESSRYILAPDRAPLLIPVSAPDGGNLTFKWYKSIDSDFSHAQEIPKATSESLAIDTEGYYFLEAINHKNKTEEKANSKGVHAVLPGKVPVLINAELDAVPVLGDISNPDFHINLTVGEVSKQLTVNFEEDSQAVMSYQWYNQNGLIEGAQNNTYNLTLNDLGNSIYLIATNNKNDNPSSTRTCTFLIMRE